MAENIAGGIGPAIQTFLQMSQFLDARRAQGRQDQGNRDAVQKYMPGAPAPGGVAPMQGGDAPPPPIAPPQMSGMGLPGSQPMPQGGAGPGPVPVGGGQHPLAALVQALAVHGGGGQGGPPPPQAMQPQGGGPGGVQAMPQQPMAPSPPPRDANVSSTAQPVEGGDFKDQSSATLAAVAKSITSSVPGITGQRLYQAMHSQIEMMKGVAPEAKAYMQSQVGMARVQEQYAALQERTDRDVQASADRISKLEEDNAKYKAQIDARHQDVGARNEQSDKNNLRTTATSAANTRYRGGVSTENNKRTTSTSRDNTNSRNDTSLKRQTLANQKPSKYTQGAMPRPKTPADAAKLPKGTQFVDPSGTVRTR